MFTIPFIRESVASTLTPAAFLWTEPTVPIRKARYYTLTEMKMIVYRLKKQLLRPDISSSYVNLRLV